MYVHLYATTIVEDEVMDLKERGAQVALVGWDIGVIVM